MGIQLDGVNRRVTTGDIVSGTGTISGNLGIGGTLTYEDVTNVDSIGIVTARSGIKIGPTAGVAGTFFADGSYITAGIVTATNFVGGGANITALSGSNIASGTVAAARVATLNQNTTGTSGGLTGTPNIDCGTGSFTGDISIADTIKHTGDTDTKIRFPSDNRITFETGGSEKLKIDGNGQVIFTNSIIAERYRNDTGGGITGDFNHNIMDYGLVYYGATNATGSFTFNLRGNGSTTFEAITNTGTTTAFTIFQAVNNTGRYLTAFKIDGSTQTVQWNGGSAPSASGSGGIDVYTFQILKTGSSSYVVLGNYANFD